MGSRGEDKWADRPRINGQLPWSDGDVMIDISELLCHARRPIDYGSRAIVR